MEDIYNAKTKSKIWTETWKEFLINFLGTIVPLFFLLAYVLVTNNWGEIRGYSLFRVGE